MKNLAYKQIEHEICERICRGIYQLDSKMPTERMLQEEFKVSRLTIAKSLSLLEQQNYLTRKIGSGTFVCKDLPVNAPKEEKAPGMIHYISIPMTHDGIVMVKSGVAEGIYRAISNTDYKLSVEFFDKEEEQIKLFRNYKNANNSGFVIWPSDDARLVEFFEHFRKADFPFVLIDCYFPEFKCDLVHTNNILGSMQMIDYLYSLGHRRIAYLTVRSSISSMNERLGGFFLAMGRHNLDANDLLGVIPDDNHVTPAAHGAKNDAFINLYIDKLLAQKEKVTAIFCSNDYVAINTIKLLKERGIRVPEDMSVVGFDNVDKASWMKPELTTIAQDFEQMGLKAGEIILARCKNRASRDPIIVEVTPRLIVRKSAMPPAK